MAAWVQDLLDMAKTVFGWVEFSAKFIPGILLGLVVLAALSLSAIVQEADYVQNPNAPGTNQFLAFMSGLGALTLGIMDITAGVGMLGGGLLGIICGVLLIMLGTALVMESVEAMGEAASDGEFDIS